MCNVYLPPASSLKKRDVDEQVARSFVEDILAAVPTSSRAFICGDFNTRVGTCSPCVNNLTLPRLSEDPITCARAQWLIPLCEIHKLHLLNGV
jgi:hypothetical protein